MIIEKSFSKVGVKSQIDEVLKGYGLVSDSVIAEKSEAIMSKLESVKND